MSSYGGYGPGGGGVLSGSYQQQQQAGSYQQQQQGYGMQTSPTPSHSAAPGSMTYTMSTGPDGRTLYHTFVAEAASYRTGRGEMVPGIQWVPMDTLDYPPGEAQPASLDWINRWGSTRNEPEDERLWREWAKMEEKRQRRDMKDQAKLEKAYDKERRRGARSRSRDPGARRGSLMNGLPAYDSYGYGGGGGGGGMMQPGISPSGFLTADEPVESHGRRLSQATAEIDRQMARLDLDNQRSVGRRKSFSNRSGRSGRERRVSFGGATERPVGLAGGYDDMGGVGVGGYGSNAGYGGGAYNDPSLGGGGGMPVPISDRSPAYSYSGLPPTGGPGSLTGGGIGQSLTAQRAGMGGLGSSPYGGVGGGQLSSSVVGMGIGGGARGTPSARNFGLGQAFPDAFGRLPSNSMQYGSFEAMLITHLDNLLIEIPRLPALLVPHDITHQDWISFMQDLASIWGGQTPLPLDNYRRKKPRRSTITANLIDQWNASYFLPRRIEVVLVKGRTRYSGVTAGRIDPRLARAVDEANYDEDDSDDSTSDDDDLDSEYDSGSRSGAGAYGYNSGYGLYGSGNQFPGNSRWMNDTAEAMRNLRRSKREKRGGFRDRAKRHRKEEKKRKRYSLYVMSTL